MHPQSVVYSSVICPVYMFFSSFTSSCSITCELWLLVDRLPFCRLKQIFLLFTKWKVICSEYAYRICICMTRICSVNFAHNINYQKHRNLRQFFFFWKEETFNSVNSERVTAYLVFQYWLYQSQCLWYSNSRKNFRLLEWI